MWQPLFKKQALNLRGLVFKKILNQIVAVGGGFEVDGKRELVIGEGGALLAARGHERGGACDGVVACGDGEHGHGEAVVTALGGVARGKRLADAGRANAHHVTVEQEEGILRDGEVGAVRVILRQHIVKIIVRGVEGEALGGKYDAASLLVRHGKEVVVVDAAVLHRLFAIHVRARRHGIAVNAVHLGVVLVNVAFTLAAAVPAKLLKRAVKREKMSVARRQGRERGDHGAVFRQRHFAV